MRVQCQVCRGDPNAPHHRQGIEVAGWGLRDNVAMLGTCHGFGPWYDCPHWDHVKMGHLHVFFWGKWHVREVLLLLLLATVLPLTLPFPLSILLSLEVSFPLQVLFNFPFSAWNKAED